METVTTAYELNNNGYNYVLKYAKCLCNFHDLILKTKKDEIQYIIKK